MYIFQVRKLITKYYLQGKVTDYCILILEGRAEVIIGADNLTFEAGPFYIFGLKFLSDKVGLFS